MGIAAVGATECCVGNGECCAANRVSCGLWGSPMRGQRGLEATVNMVLWAPVTWVAAASSTVLGIAASERKEWTTEASVRVSGMFERLPCV
eukprot:165004-Chlamydomonas_euryale.AAC.1